MRKLWIIAVLSVCLGFSLSAAPIDRRSVVSRHDIVLHATMANSPTQVGNGKFAFGMDITGLQSFVPFNTLSDWSWHSFPLPEGVKREDYHPVYFESHGKSIPYLLNDPDHPEISKWLKVNPHRYNLGRIGMCLIKSDGSIAAENDLTDCTQTVTLWDGIVTSCFSLEGEPVKVVTCCDPEQDMIEVSVDSRLLEQGRISFFLDLPYADSREFPKQVGDYESVNSHVSKLILNTNKDTAVEHIMDDAHYWVKFHWMDNASVVHDSAHKYIVKPLQNGRRFSFACLFTQDVQEQPASVAGRTFRRSEVCWRC